MKKRFMVLMLVAGMLATGATASMAAFNLPLGFMEEPISEGGPFMNVSALAVDTDGTLFVGDFLDIEGDLGRIYRMDLASGTVTTLMDFPPL